MEVSLDLRFHHVGLACEDIEVERAAHRLLAYTDEGLVFVDPRQRIRGCFMVQGGMRIELLQPEGEGSPLRPHLTRGIKMYHQAFETDAIEASIDELRRGGAALAVPPTPAVAFGGRPIAFLMLRTTMLVELIQAPLPSDAAERWAEATASTPSSPLTLVCRSRFGPAHGPSGGGIDPRRQTGRGRLRPC
jgi:methylmalonyl-CoA/ethylmalonyl-CoA epimerase